MRFTGFLGNEEAKRQLSACVDGERFPHALLIEGPAGSGRRTLAWLLAQAAVCTADGEKPCGACPACRKAAAHAHPDITVTGGDGGARSFHIDAIRAARDLAYVLPNEAPRRVILLTGAEDMTEQAQNALLKILEEPPSHTLFLLTCENRAQLLETIRSRLVPVTLAPLPEETVFTALQARLPGRPEEELRRAARLSGGFLGQALQGLEEGTFRRVQELAEQIAAAVAAPDELALLKGTFRLDKDRAAIDGTLRALLVIFRDALACRCRADTRLSVSPQAAEQLAGLLTRVQLAQLTEAVQQLQRARLRNMNQTLFITLFCARLRQAAGR